MAIRFLNQASDYLHPGSPCDSRLFHADASDQIQVWSPQLGRGYVQTIPLQDELSIVIHNYTTHNTLIVEAPELHNHLQFAFHLTGWAAGQSFFCPDFGLRWLDIWPAQTPTCRVTVAFGPSAFATYFQSVIERLSPDVSATVWKGVQFLHHHQIGCSAPSPQAALDQILCQITPPPQTLTVDQLFLEAELFGLKHVFWREMSPPMHQITHQILNCSCSGQARRTHLRQKALALVASYLNALEKPRSHPLSPEDLASIHQAGDILGRQLHNPPSVEVLARQVGLNRFKLNYGFNYVYGATPFRYLRDCRLEQARHLLFTSKLAVGEVAHQVGYTSNSSFTSAFRKQFGLNPKTFQLHSHNHPLQQKYAS